MSSKGSKTEVAEVEQVSDTSPAEEAKVLDPENPVFKCEGCGYETPDVCDLEDHEHVIPVRAFPQQAQFKQLFMRMENVEGYAYDHDGHISTLLEKVAKLENEVRDLRANQLHSTNFTELMNQIKLLRRTVATHIQTPHRTN